MAIRLARGVARAAATPSILRRLERHLVAEELLPDGTVDAGVARRRFRNVVVLFGLLSVVTFVPSLAIAGVPLDHWPVFIAAVTLTAAVIAGSLLMVEPDSPLAALTAVASAGVIFALDRLIGDYYHQAPTLFALLVAGHAIIAGFRASLITVVAAAVLVPFASVPADGPAPVDMLYSFIYLLGIASIVWAYRRMQARGAEALRASVRRYRDLVERAPAVVYTAEAGPDGRWTYVSPRARELLDFPVETWTAHQGFWCSRIHPDDRDRVLDEEAARWALGTATRMTLEYRMVAADGRARWVSDEATLVLDAEGRPNHWSGFLVDITEHHELAERLRQANRMEAIGQLAGGIAHDFNNLLTAIRGYAELLGESRTGDDSADVAELIGATDRAAALTRQLLAFSRRQALDPRVVSVSEVIDGLAPMLHRLLGEHIELTTRHGTAPATVLADKSQLEQVIVNLAVNARDAMPDGGALAIETDRVGGADAASIRLTVRDNGHGMDEATLANVFEPFFTTKGIGHGTGMGLATVYGIVRQSSGTIACHSTPGEGTVITIDLPAVEPDDPPAAPSGISDAAPARGNERILLVEDEPSVRELTRRMLERIGYEVVDVDSGAAALGLLEGDAAIDLLLTDVRMPDVLGPALARSARERRPGIGVLLMSGYPGGGQDGATMPTGDPLLAKPFDSLQLGRAVRLVLDAGTGPEAATRITD